MGWRDYVDPNEYEAMAMRRLDVAAVAMGGLIALLLVTIVSAVLLDHAIARQEMRNEIQRIQIERQLGGLR